MKIKDKYFYKTFFSLFLVVALQNVIVFSVNLADSIMIGAYSETAMSGVSLANQIQFLLQMFVNGAANGLVVISSQYWGKKQTEPIKKVFSAAFFAGDHIVMTLKFRQAAPGTNIHRPFHILGKVFMVIFPGGLRLIHIKFPLNKGIKFIVGKGLIFLRLYDPVYIGPHLALAAHITPAGLDAVTALNAKQRQGQIQFLYQGGNGRIAVAWQTAEGAVSLRR